MFVVIVVMFVMNWRLALVALSVLPILVYATKIFQVAIKATFQDVRNEVANLNGFVQERVTGMRILQLFTRENIEYQNFKEINNKHKKAHIKTVWYYSIFFPIAEIVSSIAIGLIVWYGGQQILEGFTSLGAVIAFIKMSQMLFRPLRQIADKFNTLQMGMVGSERVFKVLDTNDFIEDKGTAKFQQIKGNITYENVWFAYRRIIKSLLTENYIMLMWRNSNQSFSIEFQDEVSNIIKEIKDDVNFGLKENATKVN
jgi:subfamily B ATP-binding cassette protein MsbA